MSEILTQKEINELLAAISTGSIFEEGSDEDLACHEARTVFTDFRRPHFLTDGEKILLRLIHGNVGREFTNLYADCETPLKMFAGSVDVLTFEEFTMSVPNIFPGLTFSFEAYPEKICIVPPITIGMLDPDLVSEFYESDKSERQFFLERLTPAVTRRVTKNLVDAITHQWSSLHPLKAGQLNDYGRAEKLHYIQSPVDMVCLVVMELGVGDSEDLLILAYPVSLLKKILPAKADRVGIPGFDERKQNHNRQPNRLTIYSSWEKTGEGDTSENSDTLEKSANPEESAEWTGAASPEDLALSTIEFRGNLVSGVTDLLALQKGARIWADPFRLYAHRKFSNQEASHGSL